MTATEKLEMVQRLRTEAEDIRRHGLTNFFAHTFACARYGQASKDEPESRCGMCPMRPFVPDDFREEAFPCQHIDEEGWNLAAEEKELAASYVAWLLKTATELEVEAARLSA